jgi:outer membrane protein, heavy metal efflux system
MSTSTKLAIFFVAASLRAQATLEEFERLALARNPAIAQAEAAIQSAAGRTLQAGLRPNPTLGLNGEHVARVTNAGAIGPFLSQRFVTANKLGLSKAVARQEQTQAERDLDTQRQRVRNAVRVLFYQALAEQRRIAVREEMTAYAKRSVQIARELANVGLTDRPQVLAAEIDLQRIELDTITARNALTRTWRQLAAAVNQPELTPVPLEGDLDALPKVEIDAALQRIFAESPELRSAEAGVARAESALRRAKVDKIPDLQVRAGVRRNGEWAELPPPASIRRVGAEAIFDVGFEIPLFNRNQGNIAAARADVNRAKLAVDRRRLALRTRLATVAREFSDAQAAVERYRVEMVPRATEAFQLYTANFRQMSAPYTQVLMTQRSLIELREAHVRALEMAWRSAIEIDGLLIDPAGLLDSGSAMPAAAAASAEAESGGH